MTEFHTPIARVESVETHPDDGLGHLSVVTVLGRKCISGNLEDGSPRYKVGDLVLFCPNNSIIPLNFLKFQGFYWDAEKDRGMLKGSKRNRIGAVARGTVTSEGLLFPTSLYITVENTTPILEISEEDFEFIKEGDDLKNILGITEFKG